MSRLDDNELDGGIKKLVTKNAENVDTAIASAGKVKRCAVCKIDLKGRFVYVDDAAQELLGFTGEELFGKRLSEFVEQSQRSILSRLTEKRNHYESFFESVTLTLVNRAGTQFGATIIFSLNFIAGNPANFQLIIGECSGSGTSPPQTAASSGGIESDAAEFVRRLAGLISNLDWSVVVSMTRQISSAEMVIVYRTDDKTLKPIAANSVSATDHDALASAPKARGLHKRVARSGEMYDSTDEKCVRQAIEAGGAAPSELVARIESSSGPGHIIRVVFSGDESSQSAAQVDTARQFIGLVSRLIGGDGVVRIIPETQDIPSLMLAAVEKLSPGAAAEWVKKSSSRPDNS